MWDTFFEPGKVIMGEGDQQIPRPDILMCDHRATFPQYACIRGPMDALLFAFPALVRFFARNFPARYTHVPSTGSQFRWSNAPGRRYFALSFIVII